MDSRVPPAFPHGESAGVVELRWGYSGGASDLHPEVEGVGGSCLATDRRVPEQTTPAVVIRPRLSGHSAGAASLQADAGGCARCRSERGCARRNRRSGCGCRPIPPVRTDARVRHATGNGRAATLSAVDRQAPVTRLEKDPRYLLSASLRRMAVSDSTPSSWVRATR